jgi:hypothetical protein
MTLLNTVFVTPKRSVNSLSSALGHQPTLFVLKDDRRPASERTAAGRLRPAVPPTDVKRAASGTAGLSSWYRMASVLV